MKRFTRIAAVLVLLLIVAGIFTVYYKRANLWIPDYLSHRLNSDRTSPPTDLILLVADHYEPGAHSEMVNRWVKDYPRLFSRVLDADGRPPQHTWFYPIEQFREDQVRAISQLAEHGYGELEVHLHHGNDDSKAVEAKFKRGLVDLHATNRPWGFVHGNWALDNSVQKFCGANDEISILRSLGAYADFTFPAYTSASQPRMVNRIYYAVDDPARPKSYDSGVQVKVGTQPPAEGFMIMEGPLQPYWRWPRLIPNVDYGGMEEPTDLRMHRVREWLKADVHVVGRPEWVFVKLHTHGAYSRDSEVVLSEGTVRFYRDLIAELQAQNIRLHFVTARESYNIIKAAEAGKSGDPNQYRDFLIPKPLSYADSH